MLRLRVVQAEEGDCLLVMHGQGDRRTRLLVDGGPAGTFERHLRPTLDALRPRTLDAVVLSHADNDHVLGLRDLFSELRDTRDEGRDAWIEPGALWLNAFSETLGDGTIRSRLASLAQAAGTSALCAAEELLATADASMLKGLARDLGVAINPLTSGRAMLATRGAQPILVGGLSVRVVGPTRTNLDALRDEWRAWLDQEEASLSSTLSTALDRSVPNLSSLQLLVEADGRRILLTGDGRGDHLLDALDEQRLLDAEGRIHVDVLKLPHHGSARNMPKDFFDRVIADVYVVSANGRYDNPDRATLEALHDAARTTERTYSLVVTNCAPTVRAFGRAHPASRSGYRLVALRRGESHVDVLLR